MSVFTINNKFLDAYDPFWICRILALKMGTVAILLFLCNAFLKAPQSPVSYMLAIIVGTAASELSPVHSRLKKVGIFLGIVLVLATTGALFSLFSYFKLGLFLVVISFTYLVLRFMAINTKVAALPVFMIVWGIMQLGGGAATDLIGVLNDYLYYFEFGLMGVITIIFFPDFTPNIFKSALIRILESDLRNIGNKHYKNSNPNVLAALYMIRAKLPVLPDSYGLLYAAIIQFQNEFMKPNQTSLEDQRLAKSIVIELIEAINHRTNFTDTNGHLTQLKELNQHIYTVLAQLIEGYQSCQA